MLWRSRKIPLVSQNMLSLEAGTLEDKIRDADSAGLSAGADQPFLTWSSTDIEASVPACLSGICICHNLNALKTVRTLYIKLSFVREDTIKFERADCRMVA